MEVARKIVRLVASTEPKASSFVTCALSGGGGIGKTTLVEEVLTEMKVRHTIMRAPNHASLVKAVHDFRAGGVIILDDADNLVLGGAGAMNFMKQLISPKAKREIIYETVMANKNARSDNPDPNIPPPRFTVLCGVIWITNVDITDPTHVSADRLVHIEPLIDRGLKPVRLSRNPLDILEYVLWMATDQGVLKKGGYSLVEANDALEYFVEHAWWFPTLSLRTLIDVADTRAADPEDWRDILDNRLLTKPITNLPLPPTPKLVPPVRVLATISDAATPQNLMVA